MDNTPFVLEYLQDTLLENQIKQNVQTKQNVRTQDYGIGKGACRYLQMFNRLIHRDFFRNKSLRLYLI